MSVEHFNLRRLGHERADITQFAQSLDPDIINLYRFSRAREKNAINHANAVADYIQHHNLQLPQPSKNIWHFFMFSESDTDYTFVAYDLAHYHCRDSEGYTQDRGDGRYFYNIHHHRITHTFILTPTNPSFTPPAPDHLNQLQ